MNSGDSERWNWCGLGRPPEPPPCGCDVSGLATDRHLLRGAEAPGDEETPPRSQARSDAARRRSGFAPGNAAAVRISEHRAPLQFSKSFSANRFAIPPRRPTRPESTGSRRFSRCQQAWGGASRRGLGEGEAPGCLAVLVPSEWLRLARCTTAGVFSFLDELSDALASLVTKLGVAFAAELLLARLASEAASFPNRHIASSLLPMRHGTSPLGVKPLLGFPPKVDSDPCGRQGRTLPPSAVLLATRSRWRSLVRSSPELPPGSPRLQASGGSAGADGILRKLKKERSPLRAAVGVRW